MLEPESSPWLEPCYYCGIPAEAIDHVVPQSLLRAVRNSGDEEMIAAIEDKHRRLVVPSCSECNSLAGAVYDSTLADRKARVKAKLRRRYAETLAIPDWNNHELMDLSPGLRNRVLWGIQQRDLQRKRVGW